MPSGFGELTDQAHDLVSAGDLAGAQRLLADALTGADPRPANATPELAEAASLHARVLVALGEPHSARAWAAFAYNAATRLHGRSDPRTVGAAATLAAVLHRVGSWSRAARLYQEVIIELTASDGPESVRVLAAHADLATVEYARGQCQVARDRLQDAWELHREVYGDGHPSGIKMLARLGSMQRDCGQFGAAHDNLALARELCRQYLDPDDPLTAQVAALARAAANPDHVCADTPPVGAQAPAVPAARVPPTDTPPHQPDPQHQPDPPPQPDQSRSDSGEVGPAGPSEPDRPSETHQDRPSEAQGWPSETQGWPSGTDEGYAAQPVPGGADRAPSGTADHHPAAEQYPAADHYSVAEQYPAADQYPVAEEYPAADQRPVAEQHPVEGYHPSQGYSATGHPAGGVASPVPTPRQPVDGPAGPPEDWWTGPAAGQPDLSPYPPDPDPYPSVADPYLSAADPYPSAPAEPSAAVPPSVVELAGSAPQRPGVYRLRRVDEPDRPQESSRLLPVPVRPAPAPPRRPRRLVLFVAAGVAVVLLGTAAVIAGVSRVDNAGSPGDTPSGSPTPSATGGDPVPASPGAPPTGLGLEDNRDSVTLKWKYPAGSEGPVIVSGGRRGQLPTPFADLPAGTESFIVYSLDRRLDYCFTVAVAWSTDTVARSDEVCTERR